MKAAQYAKDTTDPSDVKLVTVEKPTPSPGLAVVKVQSAAINPIDWKIMEAAIWPRPLPFTMGYDFAGTIDGLDASDESSSSSFKVGDGVFAVNWGKAQHNDEGMPIGGAFAEYILIPLSKLSTIPDGVSFHEAAAVALAGTTAYQGLFDMCKITSGSKVLVLGGSSAVGSLAIQIAKDAGAWVATTCSGRTKSFVESFNSTDLIVDYTKEKWEYIESLKGLDAVLDTVGELEAFKRATEGKVLKEDGAFATTASIDVGFDPAGHPPLKFAAFYCLSNSPQVQEKLAAMIAFKKLKCVIEKTFPFTDEGVQDMISVSKKGKACGKLVLEVSV